MALRSVLLAGVLAAMSAPGLLGGNSIVENGDFSKNNQLGLPVGWIPVNNSAEFVSVKDADGRKAVELKCPAGKTAFLVQRELELVSGKSYKVNYDVKGTEGSAFRVYLEWTDKSKKDDAPDRLKAIVHNATWQKPSLGWTRKSFDLTCPGENYSSPYIVLNMQGPGEVCFRDVEIVEAAPAAPVAASAPAPSNAASSSALLPNGDLENGLIPGMALSNASIIKDPVASGTKALKLSGDKASAVIKGVKTEPGRRYKLSYIAKAGENVLSNTGFQYFRVHVSWPGAEQKNGLEWQDTWQSGYQKKELVFTAPKINFHQGMTITCELNDAGSLYLDNFSLDPLPSEKLPDVRISLEKPFYRNVILSTDPVSEIVGAIAVGENVASVELSLLEQGADKPVFQKKFSDVKGQVKFSIPAGSLKFGKHALRAAAFAKDGAALDKADVPLWKLDKAGPEVACKSDMNFYVNGKLFYPVVFWRLNGLSPDMPAAELRASFYHMTRRGVNTFLVNVPKAKGLLAMLDIAKEFDAKIILFMNNVSKLEKNTLLLWKQNILDLMRPEVVAHEALFGYLLTDEPMWRGVPLENLLVSYDFIKDVDPRRPIWINEAPRGVVKDLAEYSAAADIWGVDIYPVPAPNSHSSLEDKGLTSVGKYTQSSSESVNGRKPVWMALQGFSWHSFSKRPKAYPTIEESRFMALDCVVNGAQGVSYWGMEFIDDMAFFDVLFDTTRMLRDISGALTLPEAPKGSFSADNPAIKFSARQKDGKVFIVAVNESDKEAAAKFSGKLGARTVRDVLEGRDIKCDGDSFSDKFPPYGFHVYATGDMPAVVSPPPALNEELEKIQPPHIKRTLDKLNSKKYAGKASWIWYPKKSGEPYSTVAFKKEFKLDELPVKAGLLVTADDKYVVHVNGVRAGEGDNWADARVHDVSKMLRKGDNVIFAEAADAGVPPCGFLADLTMLQKDGSESHILSDASWKVRLTKEYPGRPDAEFSDAVNADKIADYGGPPWGDGIIIREK